MAEGSLGKLVLLCGIKVMPECPVTPEHTRDLFHMLFFSTLILYCLSSRQLFLFFLFNFEDLMGGKNSHEIILNTRESKKPLHLPPMVTMSHL